MDEPIVFTFAPGEQRLVGTRGLIEWTPGKWWVAEVTHLDGSLTPLYEGRGEGTTVYARAQARRTDATRWLREHETQRHA